jgi:hypothetical protein
MCVMMKTIIDADPHQLRRDDLRSFNGFHECSLHFSGK